MSLVNLAAGVPEAIRLVITGNDSNRPIRIDLHSTGCCDASLGLFLDEVCENDLIQQTDGLTFVVRPVIHEMAGEVTISCAGAKDKLGFVLESAKPLNDWDGFGVCHIKT
ncbi:MAG: hypothetical protein AB2L12_08850 [Smithellaceae bacterium]